MPQERKHHKRRSDEQPGDDDFLPSPLKKEDRQKKDKEIDDLIDRSRKDDEDLDYIEDNEQRSGE